MWGTLAFAPLLRGLSQIVLQQIAEYTNFIFGALLITILVFQPEGAIDRRLEKNMGTFFRGERHRGVHKKMSA